MGQKRYDRLHYMDTGTASVVWSLINEGVTAFDDDLAPKTETKQYIADQNERDEVVGYKPSFKYTAEYDETDPVCMKLYAIGANQQIGATVDIVTIDVWTEQDGVCEARKGTYNVIPSKAGSGAPGGALTMEGTLSQVGDLVSGTWDVSTNTFTAGTVEIQTVEATVATGATLGGTLVVDVTARDMNADEPVSLSVPVEAEDTDEEVAAKIRAAAVLDATVYSFFDIGGTGALLSFSTLVAALVDDTMAIELTDADSTGVTFS
jgi:hypothetical protein